MVATTLAMDALQLQTNPMGNGGGSMWYGTRTTMRKSMMSVPSCSTIALSLSGIARGVVPLHLHPAPPPPPCQTTTPLFPPPARAGAFSCLSYKRRIDNHASHDSSRSQGCNSGRPRAKKRDQTHTRRHLLHVESNLVRPPLPPLPPPGCRLAEEGAISQRHYSMSSGLTARKA